MFSFFTISGQGVKSLRWILSVLVTFAFVFSGVAVPAQASVTSFNGYISNIPSGVESIDVVATKDASTVVTETIGNLSANSASFGFTDLPDGTWTVSLTASGTNITPISRTYSEPVVVVNNVSSTYVGFDLANFSGQVTHIPDDVASIDVTASDGTSTSSLSLTPTGSYPNRFASFSFSGLNDGSWDLTLTGFDSSPATVLSKTLGTQIVVAGGRSNQSASFDLASLSGYLVNIPSGITSVDVVATQGNLSETVTIVPDPNNQMPEFIFSSLPDGNWSLIANAKVNNVTTQTRTLSQSVSVPSNDGSRPTIDFASISGYLNHVPSGITAIDVIATQNTTVVTRSLTNISQWGASFSFTGLSDGLWTVEYKDMTQGHSGQILASQNVTVTSSEYANLNVYLDGLCYGSLGTGPGTVEGVLQGRNLSGTGTSPISGQCVNISWGQNNNLSAATDANGHFSVSGLPLGQDIRISYWPEQGSVFEQSESVVRLSADVVSKTRNLTLSRIPLGTAGISISLQELDVNGTPTGHTVGSSEVWVYFNRMGGGNSIQLTRQQDGTYTSPTNLPSGPYYISANGTQNNYYEYPDWASSQVNLTTGVTSKTIKLKKLPSGSAHFSGTLTDSRTNLAISGAHLNLSLIGSKFNASQETSASGTWDISGLPNGSYRLWVSAPYSQSGPSYEYMSEPLTVEITNGVSVSNQNLSLRSLTEGTASISGKVKDSKTHKGIAGVTVTANRIKGGYAAQTATTDSNGNFEISRLPEGQYYLSYSAEGYESPRGSLDEQVSGVEIEAGEKVTVSTRLNPVPVVPSGTSTLSGTILNSDGEPVSGLFVNVYSSSNLMGARAWANTRTDSDGYYEIEDLARSVYTISVYSQSNLYASKQQEVTLDSERKVSNLTIETAGTLRGTVSTSTGAVPQGVGVVAYNASGEIKGWSSSDPETGEYTMAGLAPGNYTLRFTTAGWQNSISNESYAAAYWTGTQPGSISSGSTSAGSVINVTAGQDVAGYNIELQPGTTLTGLVEVQTSTGKAALPTGKYISVNVYRKAGNDWVLEPMMNAYVGSETGGTYSVRGLAAGDYKLEFKDTWQTNRSYATEYNGNATSLESADVIRVTSAGTIDIESTVMEVVKPVVEPEPVSSDQLTQDLEGSVDAPQNLDVGQTITVNVGEELAGEYVSVWAHSTPTQLGDWALVAADGSVTATVSESLPAGNHRIVVQDVDNQVVGWTPTTVAASVSGGSSTGGITLRKNSALSNIGTVVPGLESPVKISPKKSTTKKQDVAEEASSSSEPTETAEPNFWIFGGLAAVLAAGVAGGVWLIRSRRS